MPRAEFLTLAPGTNPGLPQCGQILYQLSHKGSKKGIGSGQKARQEDSELTWFHGYTKITAVDEKVLKTSRKELLQLKFQKKNCDKTIRKGRDKV